MFLLYALSLSFNIHKLNKRITTVDNQINKIFKNTLPDVRKIINPKAQLQQRLAEIRKNSGNTKSGFLPLLAKSASSITKTKNIKLNSMVYKDGQLDMELVVDNFQSLDALKSKIESRGIVTEILSASADEKTVLGRIRLNEKK